MYQHCAKLCDTCSAACAAGMDMRQQQLDIMVSTFHDTLARARHDSVSQAG